MWERCRDRIAERGGTVLLQHRVDRFEVTANRVTSARVQTPAGERTFTAEHFISTMSLRAVVRAFGDEAPIAVRAAAERLSYRDFVIVALVVDHPALFPDNWIYIHSPGVSVGRIQNFKNWSAEMVPDPNSTVLGMEYFCFQGDPLWSKSDEELVALATGELESLGLAGGARVIEGTVLRVPEAYPTYDATYRESVATIREFLDPLKNFHTIGRNGMHKYNNQDHSMFTAMLTVENMCGASHDVWSVNTDFDYHEEVRVDHGSPLEAAGRIGSNGQRTR
jgi:protoporphyrinogen oxidase